MSRASRAQNRAKAAEEWMVSRYPVLKVTSRLLGVDEHMPWDKLDQCAPGWLYDRRNLIKLWIEYWSTQDAKLFIGISAKTLRERGKVWGGSESIYDRAWNSGYDSFLTYEKSLQAILNGKNKP